MTAFDATAAVPVFAERPTELLVTDAYRFGTPVLVVSAALGVLGFSAAAFVFLCAAVFVGAFFRNPDRLIPGDEPAFNIRPGVPVVVRGLSFQPHQLI